ncbi:hypothetical protein J6590_002750 [Homalodisca vitripennis]|nr:hypothetical protein J6590_002750 [Homalodisca vitripennis]
MRWWAVSDLIKTAKALGGGGGGRGGWSERQGVGMSHCKCKGRYLRVENSCKSSPPLSSPRPDPQLSP